ncbi:GTP pyrophosphokinase family protein [Deinococcus sp. Leaf326]|jgi:ppGpp synthetase/RelA/SpoT-type nucleotidyltranferase|uniref:GTP pyrophosphokinase n=1 Tax=Deinococcus sp. Leaf326 TaxID=1736338 RepID=UPI000B2C35AD
MTDLSASVRASPERMVSDYQTWRAQYEALRDAAVAQMGRLVHQAGLNIHHITGRVKQPLSLADKLRRKPGRYTRLGDVTDLVAVRVITYFESDVQVVAALIEAGYAVDWDHSVDKSKTHDPDRFGYMGMHYVVYPPAREPEFAGLGMETVRFEIQIRSILQHAWAEIEHDLGYKNRDAVPREVRRRFYRLAGLLEMADEEFMALARMNRDYAATLPTRVAEEPEGVFVDVQSVTYLLDVAPVRRLDEAVADALNVTLLVGWPDPERPQRLTSLLQYVGVRSVGQLQKELARHETDILRFAAALLPRLREAWTPAGGARPGTSLVHYALLRACTNPGLDPAYIVNLLDLTSESGIQMAGTVREVYEGIIGRPASG